MKMTQKIKMISNIGLPHKIFLPPTPPLKELPDFSFDDFKNDDNI